GPSGSGKSTLLNTLALRLDRNMSVSGELKLNGQDYSNAELKKISGYVMQVQDDLLNAHLTVEETLGYTAELRMPRTTTVEERRARVKEVMEQVGLTHVSAVIVGSPLRKGISGGERKRLCVAMELLTKPLLLFLDEPTSGLDSVTALSLCKLLKRLATGRTCTVVCTIHQPQAKIFNLFDHLLLLNRGTIMYQGPAQKALGFFDRSGFPCPQHENPADHFLDVITPNMNDSVESLVEKEAKLKEHYQAPPVEHLLGTPKPLVLPRDSTPWHKQFRVLLRRSIKETWRKRDTTYVLLIQTALMAVLIGTVFLRIGTDQKSAVRRNPVLFFTVINQGGGLELPSAGGVVRKDRASLSPAHR
ncbi:ATP-binding cassette sub-family G member 2, partial [Tetrabaena socialis]